MPRDRKQVEKHYEEMERLGIPKSDYQAYITEYYDYWKGDFEGWVEWMTENESTEEDNRARLNLKNKVIHQTPIYDDQYTQYLDEAQYKRMLERQKNIAREGKTWENFWGSLKYYMKKSGWRFDEKLGMPVQIKRRKKKS